MPRNCRIWPIILPVLLPAPSAVLAADPPAAGVLAPLVVAAPKFNEETLIDRKVYRVATDIQSTFGSVSDVLGIIPAVTVDADGGVALRGDTNVLILIDGKPSAKFAGRSAGENLLSLSAQDIERIEVLTTPPADYKADGAAGVINIVTRKKRQPGLLGQVQAGLGPQGRQALGAGASWEDGPLTASASLGFRQELRQRALKSDLRTLGPAGGAVTDSTVNTDETIHRSVPTMELHGEEVLDERQTISAALSWSKRGGLRTYTENTAVGAADLGLTHAAQRLSTGHDPETDVDARLGYTRKLAQAGATLELSLHRSSSRQHEHYDYADTTFIPPQGTAVSNLDFSEAHAITDVGADYAASPAEGQKLKLGYAFQLDNYTFNTAAGHVDPATGVSRADLNLSNVFQYRQRLHAAYASYQVSAEKWTWLGGVRMEQTQTESWQLTNQIYRPDQYFKAYPSVHIDRTLSGSDSVSFGFSERITRPEPDTLNPFVDREYTPNLQAGNAALKPQTTRGFELGIDHESEGQRLGVLAYLRQNKDSVTDVTQYLGNGFSLTTKTNLPRNDATGAEFTASGRMGSHFNYSVSGNLFHSQIDASALGQSGLQSTTGLNAKLKLSYQMAAGDAAQITLSRTDRRLTPQGYVSAVKLVNLGYRHVIDTDLTAVVTLSDVFNGQRIDRTVGTAAFVADYVRAVQGRVLYVGFVRRFGSTKKGEPVKFDYDQ